MSDVALTIVQGDLTSDISVANGDLAADDGMATAVFLSLFCDAPAQVDDVLPQPGGDRRGWWADAYPEAPGDVWGSRLWLLSRAGATDATAALAEQYAQEALAWMVADGVAASVTAVASMPGPPGWIALAITITRPTGPGRLHYDYVWKFA